MLTLKEKVQIENQATEAYKNNKTLINNPYSPDDFERYVHWNWSYMEYGDLVLENTAY